MDFSEALKLLKQNKKIRHSSFEKDEYLIACKQGLNKNLMWPSFVKMKNDKIHYESKRMPSFLNAALIMCDKWEIANEN